MIPFQSFNDFDIPSSMKLRLREMKFETPTPVQAGAIPAGLAGRDIVGTAQTGTGKTGAFGIPLLASLFAQPRGQGLILAPTRELAAQIHSVLRSFSRGTSLQGALVVGGESFRRQAGELSRNPSYIVATPGRLNDHLNEGSADLSRVSVLVLDEVDRMLDMGFLPQIRDVLRHVPRERQTMLFSATLPRDLQRFVDGLVKEPFRVAVGDISTPTTQVEERIVRVSGTEEKNDRLREELARCSGKILIFARTQSRTQRLMRSLNLEGVRAVCLHGGRSQAQRKQALMKFRSGSHPVLVATDLAGRGLDVVDIDHVINFDVPATREDYIHRIGRTGRAGRQGVAISFIQAGVADEERVVTGIVPKRGPTPRSRQSGNRSRPPARRAVSGRPAGRGEGREPLAFPGRGDRRRREETATGSSPRHRNRRKKRRAAGR